MVGALGPITQPQAGDIITSDTNYTIKWTAGTADKVNIELWNSVFAFPTPYNQCPDTTSDGCDVLAANLTNTGTFLWSVPSMDDLPMSTSDYSLVIYSSDDHSSSATTGYFSISATPEGKKFHFLLIIRIFPVGRCWSSYRWCNRRNRTLGCFHITLLLSIATEKGQAYETTISLER